MKKIISLIVFLMSYLISCFLATKIQFDNVFLCMSVVIICIFLLLIFLLPKRFEKIFSWALPISACILFGMIFGWCTIFNEWPNLNI